MGVFEAKLEDIQDKKRVLRGCTLDGSGTNQAHPGLPFPPEAAEGHFRRIRGGGASCVRLVIAWEALEYAGPGIYDESRLAALRKILVAAAATGLSVFIDPVQNRWSRWLRGEGDPPWAREQRGTGQEGLQERYLDCMRHCFRRLKNCGALIGWGAAADDFSRPFLLRFAGRMREAREGTRFFIAENPGSPGTEPPLGTGEDPEWAAGAFCYYDGSAFPDYQGDLAIHTSRREGGSRCTYST